MTSRRKYKPKSPEQITLEAAARRAAERTADARLEYGVNTEALALPSNESVVVVMEKAKTKTVQTARRDPMRETLKATPEGSTPEAKTKAEGLTIRRTQALDRYEADVREMMGEGFKEQGGEFVDGASWQRAGTTERRLLAGARIDIVRSLIGRRQTAIVEMVISPAGGETWREGVARLTRETNAMAQSACVRAAVDDLIEAFEGMDHDGKVTQWRKMRCDA